MTRWSAIWLGHLVFGLWLLAATPAAGASLQLKLSNGDTLEGEPVSFNAQGIVVKKADGSFAPRVGWTNFSPAAIKELSAIKAAKPFVEGLLEPEDLDPSGTEKKAEIFFNVKIPERLDRPDARAGLGAITASPITLLWLILLYVGNIYAG